MKIHEYQAKDLFREFGIVVQPGRVAATPAQAAAAARELGLPVVIKAQVHAGGRGKAGGVKIVDKAEDVAAASRKILNLTIKGLPVRRILVSPSVDLAAEVYLSLLVDRGVSKLVFIGCAEGGVEIEETAKVSPEKILRLEVPAAGIGALEVGDCLDFAGQLFHEPAHARTAAVIMTKMGRLFKERDCELIEINPLVVTGQGEVMALDAKILLDDNGLIRHPENEALRDMDSEDADELEAKRAGLSFIRLDGNIGCMVNGAGLAMATMDIIKHFGGAPANFLDVGGSSNPNKVVTAFKAILKDPKVRLILINIFGGITRCDDIARGILAAREQIQVPVPIVVRLVGTNQKEGRALLKDTEMTVASTLEEGARLAVQMIGSKP
jgi:succinyl-CoA synthetase beta subunit